MKIKKLFNYGLIYTLSVGVLASSTISIFYLESASAAACVPPSTDYGTVTQTINVTDSGNYRIWTRMSAPNSSDNTYLLDVDSTNCYTAGGSGVPVHGGSAPYFVAGSSNWISKTSGGANIDVTLTAGNHTLKLIGASADVVVDRVLLTRDKACVPEGVGNNCATQYYVADINTDTTIDFLDFSSLASKYNQSGAGIGRNDINQDGTVNFQDFSILSNYYGV